MGLALDRPEDQRRMRLDLGRAAAAALPPLDWGADQARQRVPADCAQSAPPKRAAAWRDEAASSIARITRL
jgi:hypothetical protein